MSKLQNIVLPQNTGLGDSTRELYINSDSSYIINVDTIEVKNPFTLLSFDTYFNIFSCEKWKQYCDIKKISLKALIKGKVELLLKAKTIADTDITIAVRIVDSQSTYQTIEIDVDDLSLIKFLYIQINAISQSFSIKDAFFIRIDDFSPREINLSVVIPTFNRESYIKQTISLIDSEELKALKINFYIIDNASTLEIEDGDNYTILKNKNVGGAGGFARGMFESLKKDFSHILLMDDDITFDVESLFRLYYLLENLNVENKSSTISGAMLNSLRPYIHYENTSAITKKAEYIIPNNNLDLSNKDDLLSIINGSFHNNHKYLYCAWWFACFSVDLVKKHGLPINFFIRFDDIEYSLRINSKIISINGLCVWHTPFNIKEQSVFDDYYAPRNNSTLGAYYLNNSHALKKHLVNKMLHNIIYMRYSSARLNLLAYKHIIRNRFMHADSERLNNIVNKVFKYYTNYYQTKFYKVEQLPSYDKPSKKNKKYLLLLCFLGLTKGIGHINRHDKSKNKIITCLGKEKTVLYQPLTKEAEENSFNKKEFIKLFMAYYLIKIQLKIKFLSNKNQEKIKNNIKSFNTLDYWSKVFGNTKIDDKRFN